jgi:hypothetical protein
LPISYSPKVGAEDNVAPPCHPHKGKCGNHASQADRTSEKFPGFRPREKQGAMVVTPSGGLP